MGTRVFEIIKLDFCSRATLHAPAPSLGSSTILKTRSLTARKRFLIAHLSGRGELDMTTCRSHYWNVIDTSLNSPPKSMKVVEPYLLTQTLSKKSIDRAIYV